MKSIICIGWRTPQVAQVGVFSMLVLVLMGCSENDRVGVGGNGEACGSPESFVIPSVGPEPAEIGVQFSRGFLNCTISANEEGSWVLDLGMGASPQTEPFEHAFVAWNPEGHSPPMIYDVPHLDVHFHMVSSNVRESFCSADGADLLQCRLPPSLEEIPQSYIPGPSEPGHGVHWGAVDSPEFRGQGFTATLIYGSYDGDMVFIEPMVTGDFLLAMQAKTLKFPVPQPQAVSRTGYYPQSYAIRYDEVLDTYSVLLTDFRFREGSSG